MTVATGIAATSVATTAAITGNSPYTRGAYITTAGDARSCDTSSASGVTCAYTAKGGAASGEATATDPAAAATTKMTTTTASAAAAALCKAGHTCEQ